MDGSWSDREPGLAEAWGELARTVRRARARWPIPLALALVLTGLAVGRRALNPPTYFASVVLRATEAEMVDLDQVGDTATAGVSSAPRTAARLVEYVKMVVFTDERLFYVMEKHDLSPSLRKKNQPLAVDNFRTDLDVTVFRNDFLLERRPGDPPRSTRLEIGLWDKDPQVAFAVVQQLSDLVVAHEEIRRAEILEAARAASHQLVLLLEGEVVERNRQLNERLVAAAAEGVVGAVSSMELASLRTRISTLEDQLADARRREREFSTRRSLEQGELGMRFERIDYTQVERTPPKWQILVLTGVITFLTSLPLLALIVGAFDGRLYHAGDVVRAGGRCVGVISVWPGQAHAGRRRAKRRERQAHGAAA
jgi:uncharacterized protein involved in exopolysaccharide biosynthesis